MVRIDLHPWVNPPVGVEVVMVCSGAPEVLKAIGLCAQFMQTCPRGLRGSKVKELVDTLLRY